MSVILPDREPIPRRIANKLSDKASSTRNVPSERIRDEMPQFQNRNLGNGRVAGAAIAGILTVVEDTFGLPFGASSDIVNTEPTQDGTIYTVNVNGPMEVVAEARAFIDSGTGFTSFITDEYNIEDVEIVNTRMIRDTYQFEIKVVD